MIQETDSDRKEGMSNLDGVGETERRWQTTLVVVCLSLIFVSGLQAVRCWDIFFHLRLGKYALREGLIRVEVFSHTGRGRPYLQYQWLGHILIYAGYVLGGFNLLILVKAALIALAHGFLLMACCRRTGHTGASSFLAVLVAACALMTRSFIRAEVFSVLLLGATCWVLESVRTGRPGRLWWLLPIFAIWPNVHGAFAGGLALVGLEIGGQTVEHWLAEWRKTRRWRLPRLPRPLRVAWVVLPLAFLVTLCNPFTWRVWLVPFWLFSNPEVKQFIGEWHPPGFGGRFPPSAVPLVVLAGISMLVIAIQAVRGRKVSLPNLLRLAAFGYLALRAERQVPVFGLVCAPVFASVLDQAFRWFPSGLRKHAHRFAGAASLAGMGLLFLAAAGTTMYYYGGFGISRYPGYPFKTAAWLKKERIESPVFCDWVYGTFFLWTLDWRVNPVCIDGRAEVYGSDLIKQFRQVRSAAPGWSEKLREWAVDLVVLKAGLTGVREQLPARLHASPEWALVYWDDQSLVYVRRSPQRAPLITKLGEYRFRPDQEGLLRRMGSGEAEALGRELYRKLKQDPDCHVARMLAAEWHEKRDEYDAALKHYKEVLRREPDMGAAWLSLARAQMKFAKYDEAERAARKALSLHVPPEEVWRTIGNIHQYRQEYRAAIRAYRRAAKAAPEDWRIYLDLAVTYDTLSEAENTKLALKTVLKLNPNCDIARKRLRQLGG